MLIECVQYVSLTLISRIKLTEFLQKNDLTLDPHLEYIALVYADETLVACGGLHGNVIKCVAIDESLRGSGVALSLITTLTEQAYQLNRPHLFVYTKPEYQKLFQSCGFYLIASALPYMVLLENSRTRLAKQCEKWQQQREMLQQKFPQMQRIGAIVMNANPFTLGHRYLVEQALQRCDHLHLFVVGEDCSQFSYHDRLAMVQAGVADLSQQITLHEGSDYLISRATFPSYFLKEQGVKEACLAEIDLSIFREHIAPALGIGVRFVGTEPYCDLTADYNKKMHAILSQADAHSALSVVEIPRQTSNGQAISASKVRKALAEKDWQTVAENVPLSTLEYLQKIYPFLNLNKE